MGVKNHAILHLKSLDNVSHLPLSVRFQNLILSIYHLFDSGQLALPLFQGRGQWHTLQLIVGNEWDSLELTWLTFVRSPKR